MSRESVGPLLLMLIHNEIQVNLEFIFLYLDAHLIVLGGPLRLAGKGLGDQSVSHHS